MVFVVIARFSSSFDFLHLVWKSRFREQRTKNVALRVQMFRIIPTGCFCLFCHRFFCFFLDKGGWVLGYEGSVFVEEKCMVWIKEKKKNSSQLPWQRTFPNTMATEIAVKKREWMRSFRSVSPS